MTTGSTTNRPRPGAHSARAALSSGKVLACTLLAVACSRPAPETQRLLDGFEDIAAWKAVASDGVRSSIEQVAGVAGQAMRLEFDFGGAAGYAIARRPLPLDLPPNYEISFQMRADAPVNDLEIKLIDASGDNVWWSKRRDFTFPDTWQRIVVKKRHIEFAWGPTRDRTLTHAAALELAISAGRSGGRGWVEFDELTIRELPPAPAAPPRPTAVASSALPDAAPGLALDGQADSAWKSDPAAGAAQSLTLDLGHMHEFGGLILRWQAGAHAARYDVELSEDGAAWRRVRQVTEGNGSRDALLLPESDARFVRLALHAGPATGYALSEIEIQDLSFGATPTAFIQALAQKSPRGHHPRGFSGEQSYWTLVGIDAGSQSGLLSEDGALEVAKGGFSIEPFVVSGSQVTTWADVQISQSLRERYLPIPGVTWRHPQWEMQVTAFAAGTPAQSQLAARYAITNTSSETLALTLVLAVRPFQVNPPAQFLNQPGGVSPIRALGWDGAVLSVDGTPRVYPLQPPDHVSVASFDAGGFPETPAPSQGAAARAVEDPTGLASGALAYELHLAPGAGATIGIVAPLTGSVALPQGQPSIQPLGQPSVAWLDEQQDLVAALWREKLDRVSIQVPDVGQQVVDTVRSSLAHILMTRDGPILRPGTRSYARSWIRDGAMIAEGLLRLGHEAIAAAYLRWYAPYQFDNGKVPCCVDARGADPVPENDSAGELIFMVAEVYRFTGDRALLEAMWPHVEAAARYLETLRQSERTPANQTPERRALYGLLPPSISHEGYSAKPAYSYWDDFWALEGYEDATEIAATLGHVEARDRLARQRDEFRRDLHASLRASAETHGITYLPGAADLGDFDATSTTIALSPVGEGHNLPQDLLLATFERYWQEFVARRDGTKEWQAYTPYELRVVGTFIRLGWRARVQELLAFFFADRRPAAWNQWAEVVGREPREIRFIGDMPHAWISSDYIRAALDMFAHEREADQTLVLAAGVPPAWLDAPGISIRNLRTPYGPLSYSITRSGNRVTLAITSQPRPPGGLVWPWPWEGPPGPARINGKPTSWHGNELRVSELPAEIVVEIVPKP
jgi:F5/8 type C domain/Bacterial alpha-L-rhamnosidase 6 hairpin glycosidase domain